VTNWTPKNRLRGVEERRRGPSLHEQEGSRAVVVVVAVTRHQGGWENQPQGEGRQKATLGRCRLARRCQETGAGVTLKRCRPLESCGASKGARPVREGAVGKGLSLGSTRLSAYFMPNAIL